MSGIVEGEVGELCARHLVTMETPIMVTLLRPVYPSISITSSKYVCIDPVWPSVLINYCASCLSIGRLLSRLVSTPRHTTEHRHRLLNRHCHFVFSSDKNCLRNKYCVIIVSVLFETRNLTAFIYHKEFTNICP